MKKVSLLRPFPAAFLAVILVLALMGCGSSSGKKETESDNTLTQIYFLDTDLTYLCPEDFDLGGKTGKDAVSAFASALTEGPQDTSYVKLLPDGVEMKESSLDETTGVLTIYFSKEYLQMEKTREVLVRAGVVRTFCQAQGVKGVRFMVDGQEVTDSKGKKLGVMTKASFVENAKQINAYKQETIDLYFASQDGKHLRKESRSIHYSTSQPLEWAIVERLIAGPKGEGNYPTLPTSTTIISITDADGICYVNLGQSFITDEVKVENVIPIYSIVDSICENCRNITQVQFSIEGNTHISFRENMSLEKPYTPDLELVE